MPATWVVLEVIPFLVLAVGVDNIFILVQTLQRMETKLDEKDEDVIGRVTGKVGPSMTLTGLSEVSCFLLGAISNTPAVRAFALFAGVALMIDFLFQMTVFIALLSFDYKRYKVSIPLSPT